MIAFTFLATLSACVGAFGGMVAAASDPEDTNPPDQIFAAVWGGICGLVAFLTAVSVYNFLSMF